ncbi:hypothetical protein NXW89_31800 [Bacteroides thetaiotaomicron]|nr:hypothetical protein [Bacteroides thetaiotaomicron]
MQSAINRDEGANMTILKGAAATALFGNPSASGVVADYYQKRPEKKELELVL